MNQELDNISEEVLKDDETLMLFLRGELSAEDEASFLQKIQQNPDLKARAIAVARLIKGIESKGVANDEKLKSAFKKLSVDDVKNLTKTSSNAENTAAKISSKTVSVKKIFAWVASAAAVLVLMFGLRIFYVNSSNEKLALEYETAFTLSDVSRGGDDTESKLKPLFDNVLQGNNLNETIPQLSEIFAQSQSETFNEYTNYFAITGWHLALAHLKKHDAENAKTVLKTLVENSDNNPAVAKKAEDVLARIK